MTKKRLGTGIFSIDEISDIMQGLDPKKAHGYDKVSIRMLKICVNAICKPLEIVYKECRKIGLFLLEWKKGNFVPVQKNGDKQCLNNYRPVSLLPTCGKIL